MIRTLTPATNNACGPLLPLAFFFILTQQSTLLVYQLQALIPLLFTKICMRYRHKLGKVYLLALFLFNFPALLFTVMAWIWQAGVSFNGVCTFAGREVDGQYSLWMLCEQLLELTYIIINLITELRLRRTSLHPFVLSELKLLTRSQVFIIAWDFIFRFELIQKLIRLEPNGTAVEVGLTIYNTAFVCMYVLFFGGAMAFSLNRQTISFFGLHWYKARFWRLLCVSDARISESEIAAYLEHRMELARNVVPPSPAMRAAFPAKEVLLLHDDHHRLDEATGVEMPTIVSAPSSTSSTPRNTVTKIEESEEAEQEQPASS